MIEEVPVLTRIDKVKVKAQDRTGDVVRFLTTIDPLESELAFGTLYLPVYDPRTVDGKYKTPKQVLASMGFQMVRPPSGAEDRTQRAPTRKPPF